MIVEFSSKDSFREIIMFYNVENFYSVPDTSVSKNILKISGLRKWNKERYLNKLHKINNVFNLVEENEGKLPMLIGLAEIENETVMKDIISHFPLEGKYHFVHYDSLDERGVDTAILYDKRKLQLLHSETFTEVFELDELISSRKVDTTRDVLFCTFQYGEIVFSVMVVHLPSKREKDINAIKRKTILDKIKNKIKDKLEVDPNHQIIVMGDFNENPVDQNVRTWVDEDNILRNPYTINYNNEQYSTFHNGEGLLFDQMVFTKNFFNGTAPIQFEGSKVFSPHQITEWDRRYQGFPFRTYSGTRYLGGYSDHFPIVSHVKYINQL